jgi:hypothetical protein
LADVFIGERFAMMEEGPDLIPPIQLNAGRTTVNRVIGHQGHQIVSDELNAYRRIELDELRQLIDEHPSRLVRQDRADCDVMVLVAWRLRTEGDTIVGSPAGEANWGGPLDSLDERIITPHAPPT